MTKNDFIYALKASGCLYHNGQTYYEENELIRTFEDMEMFEEEKSLKDMTKLEHAIKHIKTRADAWAVKEVTEALQSISERLEPCTDAVSRQAVMKIAKCISKTAMPKYIEQLPPVIPSRHVNCEIAEHDGNGCLGYSHYGDDFPIKECLHCPKYTSYEEE